MNRTTGDVLKEIELLQNIQKWHPQHHPEWIKASAELAERYAEMARRSEYSDEDSFYVNQRG